LSSSSSSLPIPPRNENTIHASTKEIIESLDKSLGPPESNPRQEGQTIDIYAPSSSALKHFEYTEVDIDFKNIPDAIDTKEPNFDCSQPITEPSARATATTTTITTNKTNKSNGNGSITLKKHKDVIYEMYKVAKRKAQEAKKSAIRAYLEAKEIKASYLLDDLDDFGSSSGSDEEIDN
jgi:hypothetical protein